MYGRAGAPESGRDLEAPCADPLSPDRYRSYLIGRGLSDATLKNYLLARQQWMSWCAAAGIAPARATAAHVSQFWEARRQQTASSTARLTMLGVKALYKYLAGYGVANVARDLHLPKQSSRPGEPFTQYELDRLFAACLAPLDRALFLLLADNGMRDSEVRRLKEHHINWRDGTILILGKGAKYRTVAPGRATLDALAEYFQAPGHWGVDDMPHDWLERWLKRLAKAAGVGGRIHLHRMRFTFAVEFCEAGGGIDQLQSLLGHSHVEMSMYYSRKGRERRAQEQQRRTSLADRIAARAKPDAA